MSDEINSLSSVPQRSRARRFDAPRFSRASQTTDSTDPLSLIQDEPEPEEAPSEPPEPESPPVVEPDSLSDILRELKWSESDIARILVGPTLSHLTAEGLFRQHAANPATDQAMLIDALRRAGAPQIKHDPSLLSGLNPSHLLPEQPADLAQIISQFAQLPDVQKRRFLSLLNEQKTQPKTRENPAPRPSETPPKSQAGSPAKKKPAAKSDDVLSTVLKGSFDTLNTIIKGLLGSERSGKGSSPNSKGTPGRNKGSDSVEPEDSTAPADSETEETDSEPAPSETSSPDDFEDSEPGESSDVESNDIPYGPPAPDELSSELGSDREPD